MLEWKNVLEDVQDFQFSGDEIVEILVGKKTSRSSSHKTEVSHPEDFSYVKKNR